MQLFDVLRLMVGNHPRIEVCFSLKDSDDGFQIPVENRVADQEEARMIRIADPCADLCCPSKGARWFR